MRKPRPPRVFVRSSVSARTGHRRWWWALVARNGEEVCSCLPETHTRRVDAVRAYRSTRELLNAADLVEPEP